MASRAFHYRAAEHWLAEAGTAEESVHSFSECISAATAHALLANVPQDVVNRAAALDARDDDEGPV